MKSLTEAQLLKIQQDAYKLGYVDRSRYHEDCDEFLESDCKNRTKDFVKVINEV